MDLRDQIEIYRDDMRGLLNERQFLENQLASIDRNISETWAALLHAESELERKLWAA